MLMRLIGSEDKPLMPRGSKPGASWSAYLLIPIQQVIAWSGAMLAWGEFVTHGLKRFRRQHALAERAELKASRRFAWPPLDDYAMRSAGIKHAAGLSNLRSVARGLLVHLTTKQLLPNRHETVPTERGLLNHKSMNLCGLLRSGVNRGSRRQDLKHRVA